MSARKPKPSVAGLADNLKTSVRSITDFSQIPPVLPPSHSVGAHVFSVQIYTSFI